MPERCPICRHDFDPVVKWSTRRLKTCPKKSCRNTWNSRQRKGRVPSDAAMQARTERSRRLFTERLQQQFGRLSDRELEIIRAVYRVSWMRGWNKAQARYFKEVGQAA